MNQSEFSQFLRDSGLEARDIAKTFTVSIPTVKRWFSGVSMPSKYIVDLVVKDIQLMKERAKNENP